jgi:galactokinase
MTGGGFGGSVVALVDAGSVDDVVAAVESAYAAAGFEAPAAFVAEASDGSRRVR